MKILVTGGAGFIGSHVAETFIADGHDVCIVDDFSTGQRQNVPAGARVVEADLTAPEVAALIQDFRPDIIDHHAAHADVFESVRDPVADARINVLGTVALLDAAVKAQVRKVVFISTGGAIYGDPQTTPCREDHPMRPVSPYAASKLAGEEYLRMFGRTYGLDYTILRYSNVFGPRQHPYTEEGQVVALFARMMLEGKQPTIFGDGEQARDFTFVKDVARANLLALERGSRHTLNIGTGTLVTVNQLYASLQDLTGWEDPARYAPARPGEVYRIALDATLAEQELGWTPQATFEEGLRETVEWVAKQSDPNSPSPSGRGLG